MAGSTRADRSPKYLQMPQTHTSVHSVKNQTKHKSTKYNFQTSELTRNAMILLIQCYRRSWRMTFVQPVQWVFASCIKSWLKSQETPMLDVSRIPDSQSELLNKAIKEQAAIGWHLGMRGYLSRHWAGHKLWQLIHTSSRIDKGKVWVQQAILQLWEFSWEMWDHHNSILHEDQLEAACISQDWRCPNQWRNHETVWRHQNLWCCGLMVLQHAISNTFTETPLSKMMASECLNVSRQVSTPCNGRTDDFDQPPTSNSYQHHA